jgi:hypothetical protein
MSEQAIHSLKTLHGLRTENSESSPESLGTLQSHMNGKLFRARGEWLDRIEKLEAPKAHGSAGGSDALRVISCSRRASFHRGRSFSSNRIEDIPWKMSALFFGLYLALTERGKL